MNNFLKIYTIAELSRAIRALRALQKDGPVCDVTGICHNWQAKQRQMFPDEPLLNPYRAVNELSKGWKYATDNPYSPVPNTRAMWTGRGLRYRRSLMHHILKQLNAELDSRHGN